MVLQDDGDLIRGLGFVTLYAAYLEEAVDQCVYVLLRAEHEPDQQIFRRSTSQKIEYVQKRVSNLRPLPDDLAQLPEALEFSNTLLEQRNLIIHGRIYDIPGQGEVRKAGRHGIPDQPASSQELYALANQLFEMRSPLLYASVSALPRLLQNLQKPNE
jgi:hypothetical protein